MAILEAASFANSKQSAGVGDMRLPPASGMDEKPRTLMYAQTGPDIEPSNTLKAVVKRVSQMNSCTVPGCGKLVKRFVSSSKHDRERAM